MEELDSFTEGKSTQNAIRSCLNSNSAKSNNVSSMDNDISFSGHAPLASGDANNINELASENHQNTNEADKEIEENYTSTTISSRSDSSSMSEQIPSDSKHPRSAEIQQAISVAAMLQHGTDESFQENGLPHSESNEEGYDSEEEQLDETKLLEFMLQNSQSQEEFHNQYDQLTSSLKDDSSEKLTSETRLSETNLPTVLDNLNSSSALSEQNSQDEKQCWVCFASEKDDTSAVWTSPCRYQFNIE